MWGGLCLAYTLPTPCLRLAYALPAQIFKKSDWTEVNSARACGGGRKGFGVLVGGLGWGFWVGVGVGGEVVVGEEVVKGERWKWKVEAEVGVGMRSKLSNDLFCRQATFLEK